MLKKITNAHNWNDGKQFKKVVGMKSDKNKEVKFRQFFDVKYSRIKLSRMEYCNLSILFSFFHLKSISPCLLLFLFLLKVFKFLLHFITFLKFFNLFSIFSIYIYKLFKFSVFFSYLNYSFPANSQNTQKI